MKRSLKLPTITLQKIIGEQKHWYYGEKLFGLKDNYQASYTCDQIISNYEISLKLLLRRRKLKSRLKSKID